MRRARFVLLWEALWPRLVPVLAVAASFVLVSWLNVWANMPDWARYTALGAFALALIASAVPLLNVRLPGARAGFRRVENASAQSHRPALAILDRLAIRAADTQTKALWQAHRSRLLADVEEPRAGAPSPGVARRDPYGLRFLILLLLVVGFVATGGGSERIAQAFRGTPATEIDIASTRIDAWATPPDYTGRPSIYLTGEFAQPTDAPIEVPDGTELFVRAAGDGAEAIRVTQSSNSVGDVPIAHEQRTGAGPREFRFVFSEDATITVTAANRDRIDWAFAVRADEAPTIENGGPATATNSMALEIGYTVHDDYGVSAAWGDIELADPSSAAMPLVEAPLFALSVPRARGREAEATTTHDFTEHPWAGLAVDLTLVAEDAIGQQGFSETQRLILPSRQFTNPTARALVEQRQILALDSNQARTVMAAIDDLAADPEERELEFGAYLALRSAFFRLAEADDDDTLREIVDYLWQIAIGVEGNLIADAAAALQAATEALREAMERNADAAEIAALTERLGEAMQNYLDELAADAQQRNPATAVDVDAETLGGDELQALIAEMQARAEAGDMDAAERLLQELQQMMQNIEIATFDGIDPEFEQAATELRELGEILQQQQQLMDRTYALQQQQNEPLVYPVTPEEAERQLEELQRQRDEQAAEAADLQETQRQVGAQLQELIGNMAAEGIEVGELPDADLNMNEAANRLEEGRPGMAVDRQAEAIQQLRAAADALAGQLAADRQGEGPPDGGAQDPIGRPLQNDGLRFGDAVEIPDEIDRQLAREILDLIRQRLGDPDRLPPEIEYLERLLGTN